MSNILWDESRNNELRESLSDRRKQLKNSFDNILNTQILILNILSSLYEGWGKENLEKQEDIKKKMAKNFLVQDYITFLKDRSYTSLIINVSST